MYNSVWLVSNATYVNIHSCMRFSHMQVSFEEFKRHYNLIIDAQKQSLHEWTAKVGAH